MRQCVKTEGQLSAVLEPTHIPHSRWSFEIALASARVLATTGVGSCWASAVRLSWGCPSFGRRAHWDESAACIPWRNRATERGDGAAQNQSTPPHATGTQVVLYVNEVALRDRRFVRVFLGKISTSRCRSKRPCPIRREGGEHGQTPRADRAREFTCAVRVTRVGARHDPPTRGKSDDRVRRGGRVLTARGAA